MPAIVVGADTGPGRAIIEALNQPGRELRAFVTDEDAVTELRRLGVKVALGDVSDDSHVEAASTECFSAVLVTEAATDGRERSFARSEEEVVEGWARAVAGAGVSRTIWVSSGETPPTDTPETTTVSPEDPGFVAQVVALDDAERI